MPLKLDICNIALLKIGESPISSFEENSPAAILSNALYPAAEKMIKEIHPWKFQYETEEDYPQYFCNVLSLKLASEFCIPLCDNAALAKTFSEMFEAELKRAKFVDSGQNGNSAAIENFSLIEQRY